MDRNTGQWTWCDGCQTAVEYYCAEQYTKEPRWSCSWYYIHGLDSRSPNANDNESYRPQWIPTGQGTLDAAGYPWIAPGALPTGSFYA